jgi:hypothetical protein
LYADVVAGHEPVVVVPLVPEPRVPDQRRPGRYSHADAKTVVKGGREIEKFVSAAGEEQQGILLKRIHTKFNIISTVTRRIAWNSGKDTVVVNTGFFKDNDQIYVRSSKNLHPLIQHGKMLGYRCGGKPEVLGVVSLFPPVEGLRADAIVPTGKTGIMPVPRIIVEPL